MPTLVSGAAGRVIGNFLRPARGHTNARDGRKSDSSHNDGIDIADRFAHSVDPTRVLGPQRAVAG